jgi:hypothetical protein
VPHVENILGRGTEEQILSYILYLINFKIITISIYSNRCGLHIKSALAGTPEEQICKCPRGGSQPMKKAGKYAQVIKK